MDRYLAPFLLKDLEEKLVLLSGPRQVGKTTLSKAIFPTDQIYLNFDRSADREMLRKESWSRNTNLVIFDEIHKMRFWKRWLKGIYDTEGVRPRILVTGSARLDVYRKAGDSLAGRFFLYRLHPISVREASQELSLDNHQEVLERIMKWGGFPEPFLKDSETTAKRWRKTHMDTILREDLLDLEKVREIKQIEILVDLLSERVGSSTSYSSLARDLEISPHTVKKWIEILERLFVVFVVTPYSKNIARAVLKEPKIYFYDTGRVKGDEGARFENLVACALHKRNQFLEDTQGLRLALHYVKDHQQREVDFLTLSESKPEYLIETKWSDSSLSKSLAHFKNQFSNVQAIQLVAQTPREQQFGKIRVLGAANWLATLEA